MPTTSRASTARTTAVVVAWQSADRLDGCLAALTADPGLDVLVVDNGSTDATASVAAAHDGVRVVRSDRNLGFAGGAALGLEQVGTPYAALVNDDAVVRPGWREALERVLDDDPGCGLVTGLVLLHDGTVNSAGGRLDSRARGADRGFRLDPAGYDAGAEVFFGPATACLVRMAAVRAAGSVDPRLFLYYEDVDLAWRLRLGGWTVRYTPGAVALHEHGASSGASTGSSLHTRHDVRNRHLVLVKDAGARWAAREVARLPLTACSLTVKALLPPSPARLRQAADVWWALGSLLTLLPYALRQRRAVGRAAVRSRAEVDGQARALAGSHW